MSKDLENILQRIERNTLLAAKAVLTVADAALYTGLSTSTLYNYAERGIIASYKPNRGKVYFTKSDLDAWMLTGRRDAAADFEAFAAGYCLKHPNKFTD